MFQSYQGSSSPSPRGRAGRGALTQAHGLLKMRCNRFDNTVEVRKYLMVPKPDDGIAAPFEETGSSSVITSPQRMLGTVNLNHEPRTGAQEVHDKGPDRYLATKVPTHDLSPSQTLPHQDLRAGHSFAQCLGKSRSLHGPTPSLILPLQAGRGDSSSSLLALSTIYGEMRRPSPFPPSPTHEINSSPSPRGRAGRGLLTTRRNLPANSGCPA